MAEFSFELQAKTNARFIEVRKKLKQAERSIRLAFNAAIREAIKPLRDDVIESAKERLPKRGGLAAKVVDSKFAVRTRATGVLFQMTNPFEVKDIDDGLIRHPVFGNLKVWVEENIEPHFWTDPMEKDKPEVLAKVTEIMDETVKKIGE